MVSDHEAHEMLLLAKDIRQKVEDWIRKNHPELVNETQILETKCTEI